MDRDWIELEAGDATAAFARQGAELMSWRVGGRELVWHGDPEHWSRRAPILFPVVGASRNGKVRVDGRAYPMPQHGFARDMPFGLEAQTRHSCRMMLADDEDTRRQFPFAFGLEVGATLEPESLAISFAVRNTGDRPLPYALGFHPAFPWPLDGSGSREGHAVVFEAPESPEVPEIAAGGLIARRTRRLPLAGTTLPLEPELFTEALVFLSARSRSFVFTAPSGAALKMDVEDFPHLAVWSRPTAPFVSLETWTGHADWEDAADDLAERDSMRLLPPGFTARHAVRLTFDPGHS